MRNLESTIIYRNDTVVIDTFMSVLVVLSSTAEHLLISVETIAQDVHLAYEQNFEPSLCADGIWQKINNLQ